MSLKDVVAIIVEGGQASALATDMTFEVQRPTIAATAVERYGRG